ncbi:MAG: RimK family protein, partial [bacterium]|nr:RimK family protein [bacterium]
SNGDFRANVALGASVEKTVPTEEIQQIAAEIYAQTGLDFVGLDLLFGKELPYFCEINVMPGIEGMERATGVNIAARMMELILSDAKESS